MNWSRRTQCNTAKSKGAVLIELILVFPLFIIIPGSVIELARFMRMAQIANVISQEAATFAYRQCSDFYALQQVDVSGVKKLQFWNDRSINLTQNCLDNQVNLLQTGLTAYLPGSRLVLTVYRVNFDGGTGNQLTKVAQSKYPASGTNAAESRYDKQGNKISADPNKDALVLVDTTEARERQRLIVAELQYFYTPIFSLVPGFLGNGGRAIRETTVL